MNWILEKILYWSAIVVLVVIILFIKNEEQRTKNTKLKIFLRVLIIIGNLIVLVILGLCILAGVSCLKEGNIKVAVGLFLMALVLAGNLGNSLIKKFKNRN